MGSNKPYRRREFIKNILFGAGGLVFASSPLTLFPEKAEARRKRKRSKKLEEKEKGDRLLYACQSTTPIL